MLNRLSPNLAPEVAEVEQGFDLRDILNFAWRQWRFIAAIVAVTVLIGTVQFLRQTPLYTATAQVLLDPRKQKMPGSEALVSDVTLDVATIESEISIIRSTMFMRRVVEKERLVADPEFGSGPALATAATVRDPQARDIAPEVMNTIEALKGATNVGRAGQGYVLALSVTSIDPARAARLANALANAYVVDKLDARYEAAQRASAWLSDRLNELRTQLRDSEAAVGRFRAEHGIAANVTLTQQQLSDLNARLVAARAETAEKKARYELFQSSDGKAAQNVPDAANSPLSASLRQQEAQIAQKVSDLAARYSDNHPLVVNARTELRDVRRAIATETQRAIANMKNEYELAKAREEALERSFGEVTGGGFDNETIVTMRELERSAAINKSLFEDYLQKAKLTQQQSTFEAQEARVITPALAPGGPSFPSRNRYIGVSLIIGLLLGCGGAFLKEMLNAGFTSPRQAEEMLELPLLASVSRMEQRDLTVDGRVIPIPLYPIVKPLARYSESIRALRSGIAMTDVDHPPKVVQLTSALPNEGKTTVALSLAVSAASSGLKVLFIDSDLRHPSGSRVLGLQKQTGLVELLLGQIDFKEAIRYHEDGKLWTLPAGGKTQNPADLLGSDRMKAIVEQLKKSFDYIVIDTPPIGPVIDPIIVSQLVDKVVFVVRWASTARELVQRTMQQMPGHKKVAGVIFNLVNEREAKKYGKYAYSYYYGSRYYKKYYDS